MAAANAAYPDAVKLWAGPRTRQFASHLRVSWQFDLRRSADKLCRPSGASRLLSLPNSDGPCLSEMRAEDAGRRIILAYLALLVTAGCCIPTASGLVSFRTAAPYLELIGTPCILIVSFTIIKDFHARTKHDRNLQCWKFRSEVRLECKNSWTNVGVYYTYITQHTFYSIYFMMLFGRPLGNPSVCNVGVLWPNGLSDRDDFWHTPCPGQQWPCIRLRSESPYWGGN